MNKKITSALISVFYKDGIEPLARTLVANGATIYSTGGTQKFLEDLNIPCTAVEKVTDYPSILGGRVKTLHPKMFGGILARRANEQDVKEMADYGIPAIDLVIVDLYPFEQTLVDEKQRAAETGTAFNEAAIIEKIDIGGPSMIRAAAKNFESVVSIGSKDDYAVLNEILVAQNGETTVEQRKAFAAKAFAVVMNYDVAINNYFNNNNQLLINTSKATVFEAGVSKSIMRYGENPHQQGVFYGNLNELFLQLNGKELSYNNLVDVDAAMQIKDDLVKHCGNGEIFFAIIKHTNVCGVALHTDLHGAWQTALAGDPESAFGGVLVCNAEVDETTANAINEIFFEVLIAPSYSEAALQILKSKKNRILLQLNEGASTITSQYKNVLNGVLYQQNDEGNYTTWTEAGGRECTSNEKDDLAFANIICKHLKSNAIALVKNKQLIGKGCGQTSRIDALRQAIEKAKQFNFDLNGAVMASDAFFPFNDCVQMAHSAGVTSFIQPGGSIRDADSIDYCKANNLAMVITGMRHFKH